MVLELWLEEFGMAVTLVKCQKLFQSPVPETSAKIIRERDRESERAVSYAVGCQALLARILFILFLT